MNLWNNCRFTAPSCLLGGIGFNFVFGCFFLDFCLACFFLPEDLAPFLHLCLQEEFIVLKVEVDDSSELSDKELVEDSNIDDSLELSFVSWGSQGTRQKQSQCFVFKHYVSN